MDEKIDFELDLGKIQENISYMNDNHYINLNNINTDINLKNAYNYIKYINDNIDNFDISLNSFVDVIISQFRPSEIKSNTIGSFLFGCFQSSHGDIDSSCSILCNNSIKNPYNSSINACKEQIWIQSSKHGKHRFKHLESSSSDSHRCNIFLLSSFNGFTDSEIDMFQDSGIVIAQGMITKYSQHHIIFKMKSIEKLPMIDEEFNIIYNKDNNNINKYIHNTDYNNIFEIILLVIGVIIFFGFIFMNSSNMKSSNMKRLK